jgi:hypothetical protein
MGFGGGLWDYGNSPGFGGWNGYGGVGNVQAAPQQTPIVYYVILPQTIANGTNGNGTSTSVTPPSGGNPIFGSITQISWVDVWAIVIAEIIVLFIVYLWQKRKNLG